MSRYHNDPRVVWVEDNVFYLPDHDPDRWNTGDKWEISFDGQQWHAYDPDGRHHYDASYKADFEDVLAELLGPPLWSLEADMVRWAGDNEDWLNGGQSEPVDGEPDTGTFAGMAAVDNLLLAGVFRECPERDGEFNPEHGMAAAYIAGGFAGYRLTDHGRELAAALRGTEDAATEALIIDNVPHTRAYGLDHQEVPA